MEEEVFVFFIFNEKNWHEGLFKVVTTQLATRNHPITEDYYFFLITPLRRTRRARSPPYAGSLVLDSHCMQDCHRLLKGQQAEPQGGVVFPGPATMSRGTERVRLPSVSWVLNPKPLYIPSTKKKSNIQINHDDVLHISDLRLIIRIPISPYSNISTVMFGGESVNTENLKILEIKG